MKTIKKTKIFTFMSLAGKRAERILPGKPAAVLLIGLSVLFFYNSLFAWGIEGMAASFANFFTLGSVSLAVGTVMFMIPELLTRESRIGKDSDQRKACLKPKEKKRLKQLTEGRFNIAVGILVFLFSSAFLYQVTVHLDTDTTFVKVIMFMSLVPIVVGIRRLWKNMERSRPDKRVAAAKWVLSSIGDSAQDKLIDSYKQEIDHLNYRLNQQDQVLEEYRQEMHRRNYRLKQNYMPEKEPRTISPKDTDFRTEGADETTVRFEPKERLVRSKQNLVKLTQSNIHLVAEALGYQVDYSKDLDSQEVLVDPAQGHKRIARLGDWVSEDGKFQSGNKQWESADTYTVTEDTVLDEKPRIYNEDTLF